MIAPLSIRFAASRSVRFASAVINSAAVDGGLKVTSRVPGAFGNRMTIETRRTGNTGPPVFEIRGYNVTLSVPTQRTFEASGPFLYNGSPVATFLTLWWVGTSERKPRWAQDGLPFEWPIDRDGEFVIHAEGSWHMIQRSSGNVVMHWKADTDESDINLIPPGDKSEENPEGWYGAIPACTGWVSSHFGAELDLITNLIYLIETGIPENALPVNLLLNDRLQFEPADGQSGSGFLAANSRTALTGG